MKRKSRQQQLNCSKPKKENTECVWGINEGWFAVMTPSGEKTPPQQQNWQRGEERGINGHENINN